MSVTEPGSSQGRVRVGSFERERALTELRNAAAEDRISFDELEDRIPRVVGARTRADLAGPLGDLMTETALAAFFGEVAPAASGPGWRWEDPLVLRAQSWHALRLLGTWDVPPFVELQYGIGGVLIDFTHARALAPLLDVVLVGSSWGTAVLIVPEKWGVDTQGVQVDSSGSVTATVRTRPTGPDAARIVLRGRATGSLTVRTPTGRDLRRAERALTTNPTGAIDEIRRQLTRGPA